MATAAVIPWPFVARLVGRVRGLFAGLPGGASNGSTRTSCHEDELARQTLRGEQCRLAILAPLLTGMTLLVAAYGGVAWWRGALASGFGWILSVNVLSCIYEWIALRYLTRAVDVGVQPARVRFFLNAMVEISAPLAMTLIAAAHLDPVTAISGPGSYAYFLLIILSALRLDFALSLFTGVICAVVYGVGVSLYWSELERVFPAPGLTMQFSFFIRALIFVAAGWVAGLVSVRIRRSLAETVETMRERERVVALFGQHVSPKVVDRLLTGAAGQHSEVRTVCILVLDVRHFTRFAEQRPAGEVVALLNTLWSFMVRAVNGHHGFVNKFLGDGFLAVFGAPWSSGNDCQDAVAAAHRILRELDDLVEAGVLPPVEVGIAVHAGDAIVGSIGSAERKEYTVIGDVVNVAFRMEAMNKDFGSRLLISDRVRSALNGGGMEEPGTTVRVRGRREALAVHCLA